MACQISPDPTGIKEFQASSGVQLKLCISSSSGLAHLTAANLNDNDIPVNDPCVDFTLVPGPNLLEITVVTPDNNDTITVFEPCGDGTKRTIDQYQIDPQDPAHGFTINGK
jgi:hypothetical protein